MNDSTRVTAVITVTGELGPVECQTCGARTGLRVQTEEHPGYHGEIATVVCPIGDHGHHPLVYPEMVHTLVDAAAAHPGDDDAVVAALAALPWTPHRQVQLDFTDIDGPITTYYEAVDTAIRQTTTDAKLRAFNAEVSRLHQQWQDRQEA